MLFLAAPQDSSEVQLFATLYFESDCEKKESLCENVDSVASITRAYSGIGFGIGSCFLDSFRGSDRFRWSGRVEGAVVCESGCSLAFRRNCMFDPAVCHAFCLWFGQLCH